MTPKDARELAEGITESVNTYPEGGDWFVECEEKLLQGKIIKVIEDERQEAEKLRGELAEWKKKYTCCESSPTCANNRLKKFCNEMLGEETWSNKHEYLYNVIADIEMDRDMNELHSANWKKLVGELVGALKIARYGVNQTQLSYDKNLPVEEYGVNMALGCKFPLTGIDAVLAHAKEMGVE